MKNIKTKLLAVPAIFVLILLVLFLLQGTLFKNVRNALDDIVVEVNTLDKIKKYQTCTLSISSTHLIKEWWG
ncbi:hypothetical protein [Vibrio vulnificus]|nr:hypothetical protein [Vibrio vulnificus]